MHVLAFWWGFGTLAPGWLQAAPRPDVGTRSGYVAVLILGGHMGHRVVPLYTLGRPMWGLVGLGGGL